MFVKAIEEVDKFTRPIHTITRTYDGLISPGTSTLFFVNENAVAVTCKHVLQLIIQADAISGNFNKFKLERDKFPKDGKFKGKLRGLEAVHNYQKDTLICSIDNPSVIKKDNSGKITYAIWEQSGELNG
jgi:hypothetical protein